MSVTAFLGEVTFRPTQFAFCQDAQECFSLPWCRKREAWLHRNCRQKRFARFPFCTEIAVTSENGYVLHNWWDLQYKMYFPHISKSWNPNIMRCVSTLYFRQIMTALHFLCIGARWRVLPLINNWCHQVLMYWFTISSTLCRTNNFLGGNMITHRPRNRNKDKVAWWGQARANPSSAIALHQ